ncbi:3D-(3,5/4)-trihydroxycyclohexane-1,2-dione acylhydrolase (decyclizing) [Pseudoteredinibacter isoporae]|uniref:3D-(3,5/4)-trihydroxycyclohexane-1,2-dione acylhydrolase (Decyclizing) n=1 Tax=Pseudoteredinibacter isoporae TaxID=570281 RepID=A0A7X0JWI4_9GAMM|nr:3D-(3,5/4)-trihydroxycyclohexane-1,2-dione acylhydrolase (decyclizing) [Pseudoteredinibacter isoporae]MBB6522591.1 3D-(3,5/4)-trihydroxycyclohexane-1,2-dione acylhydrolase (decyclizing) [Pseudoteredinibacter isoporae]NHO88121.1 3D-(3,5/4)-trihydroxycyclohexane-1,2-dione acylhydrolase (decyclizing) [Pseudoteredinibacter isoporae]NIB23548.1 3D-(3,5/4)-trihydroxycyclohexane-1,2-dione acylhydrolase (decyclizing) [Pseudoteredinibacter isoporae]
MKKIRLTMAQAIVRFLAAQKVEVDGKVEPIFGGVFAIFGHGNVAGMGEALYQAQDQLPTFRAHNEQTMAHAAIAYAKQHDRQRMMACTSSIGPGAANMVTAAALAHVNRLPVLLLPGDVFASRIPDPVLQQVENYSDATTSSSDCFRPVSRFFDRITRPEQILVSLPMAMKTLTDPEDCGPVTLSLCQDVQAEAYDYPEYFFAEKIHRMRRQHADIHELDQALKLLKSAKRPLLIAGGGVHYSKACDQLQAFAQKHGVPVAETQAGKGALAWDHPNYVGAVGVTGTEIANKLAMEADVVLAVGSRLQDFTTGSRTLIDSEKTALIQLNVSGFDAIKHNAFSLVSDASLGLSDLSAGLGEWQADAAWQAMAADGIQHWNAYYDEVTGPCEQPQTKTGLPSDAQVLGAIKRASDASDVVICAAGGLPSELHKFWRTDMPKSYHMEYGYSCMGYEIAAGLGVKLAHPEREAIVVVGDGSYMMANSELATSVMLGKKMIVVVLDNRGFGCINRLQEATGGAPFNNLLENCRTIEAGAPKLDFAAHAAAMGALSEKVANLAELEEAMDRAKSAEQSYVITLDTDPFATSDGGCWWDVAVPEVSERDQVKESRADYLNEKKNQPY